MIGRVTQKHMHDPMLDAPCMHLHAFLDNVQDKVLTKRSYLWVNVTEVSVARASCRVSTFPFHGKDFYFTSQTKLCARQWCHLTALPPAPASEDLQSSLSPSFRATWIQMGKSGTRQPELDILSGTACVLMPGEIWQVNVCFKFLFNHSYSFNFEV